MSLIYKTVVRPILFRFDPETIHDFTINLLSVIGRQKVLCEGLMDFFCPEPLPVEVFGLRFPNPVGLAAGMDKDAVAIRAWEALGFGFVEAGAITYYPQEGNPKPRIFRVIKELAIVNRMGFNNKGAEETALNVARMKATGCWAKIPIGVNIGKSKITTIEQAAEDYEKTFRLLWKWFDFFVINVSSPNTPNLRLLQNKEELDKILFALNRANVELSEKEECAAAKNNGKKAQKIKPILVKIAPDLSYGAIEEVLNLCNERRVSGIVATNTTISRPPTEDKKVARIYAEQGGLSGRPLSRKSTEIIRFIYKNTQGKLPIIGVGGVFTAQDAWEKITSGATLVQVYTGIIYEGPMIVNRIVSGLYKLMEKEGFKNLSEAIGIYAD
ncbi:MAG: quinone-dependent dihydroorotate dehydrogenase [Verrucomicrobiia bacterium]